MRRIPDLALVVAVAFVVSTPLSAQAWKGKGRVEGRVTDQSGKPIADAVVKLRHPKGNVGPDTKSDKSGRWAYMGLASGEWQIEIEANGFIPGKIVVGVSEVQRAPLLDFKMEAAVPVAAEAATSGLPPEIVAAVKAGNEAMEAKKFGEARAAFEKAAAALPDNVSLLFALARSYSGEGNAAKAIETVESITVKEAANNGAWLLLANLKLEKGDIDGAQAALAKVPADFVKDPAVYINIGVSFMNKKKVTEAESYFTKAVDTAPEQGDAYFFRALARVQQQKNADAKADLKKFLEISPSSPDAKEAKELLIALK